jgi:hypothetical protein
MSALSSKMCVWGSAAVDEALSAEGGLVVSLSVLDAIGGRA